ncbi:MAG: SDR family oxidoreductase [Alphaproteobacteria bacterium]|nr:SDR family oxidoreductase [Alphaproteobacteria bacterium]
MTQNKVALVTGATSGIGRAAAIELLKSGYRVAACGRRTEKMADLAEAGATGAENVFIARCDVRDPKSVADLFAGINERFGRLDVVFNNAGRSAPASAAGDIDIDVWRDTIDTNINGAFYIARSAFRAMRDQTPQGGRIINNGSISAYVPRLHSAAYTTSKHAMTGLTKSLSLDGRPFSIACGQIDIGNALTDMSEGSTAGALQADGQISQEPAFDVQRVAEAVVFMAGLPLEANVQFMTIMATNMPYIGRG